MEIEQKVENALNAFAVLDIPNGTLAVMLQDLRENRKSENANFLAEVLELLLYEES